MASSKGIMRPRFMKQVGRLRQHKGLALEFGPFGGVGRGSGRHVEDPVRSRVDEVIISSLIVPIRCVASTWIHYSLCSCVNDDLVTSPAQSGYG